MSRIFRIKEHSFIADFKRGMKPNWSFSARLDELLYFPTWPLVYLLSRTRITPNQLVMVSFLVGMAFVTGAFLGFLKSHPTTMSILLILRVLLDCADGQLARYTGRTSNLGALYDLAADFVFTILFFLSLAVHLSIIDQLEVYEAVLLSLAALVFFLCSTTVFSFLAFQLQTSNQTIESVKSMFIRSLPNDRKGDKAYEMKLDFFNGVFRYTWRAVTLVVFRLFFNKGRTCRHSTILGLLSPLEYSVQLFIFAAFLLIGISPVWYLLFIIAVFGAMVLLLLIGGQKTYFIIL